MIGVQPLRRHRLGATCRVSLAAMLVLGALAGCQRLDAARARALATPAARRLVGVWRVTFTLDSVSRLRGGAQSVRGTIALIEDHYEQGSYPQIAEPTHYGTYDIDFTPFGFEARGPRAVPIAVAGVSRDSANRSGRSVDHVRIVLDPDEPRMNVTLDGTLAADTIAGTWSVESRTAFGSGVFVMRRERP